MADALKTSDLPESAQIAEILGLPEPSSFDDLKLAGRIAHGLRIRSVERVVDRIDPGGSSISSTSFVPKSTLQRRKASGARLGVSASEKLWQVTRVFVEARRQYRSDEGARAFLLRPHPLLEGRTPLDVARETAAGADLVLKLLGEAEAGIAV